MVWKHVGSKYRLFYRHFSPPRHTRSFTNSLWRKIRQYKTPGTLPFRPEHLKPAQFIKIPSETHLEAMAFGQRQNIHPWTTLFHHFKYTPQETHAQSSLRQHHQNSTVYTSFSPPPWPCLVNNNIGSSPSLGQAHQLTSYMLCKQVN